MSKIFSAIVLIAGVISNVFSQEDSNYFIINANEGHLLVHGKQFPLNIPENTCFEYLEEKHVVEGEKFIIIHVRDEMENDRGVLIFDKKKGQVNYKAVQVERKKYYPYHNCCVYVQELHGKLYFWDIKAPGENGEDYDCYYDSQTDLTGYLIPRYYCFDPETGEVETIFLSNNCTNLIEDGKIVCK